MPSRRLVKDPERYKTVLCATWTAEGTCPYGRKCQFAHGKEELRARPRPQAPLPGPLGGLCQPLPHAPMALWPAAAQQSQLGALQMPPLPPAPPPVGVPHVERGLLIQPQMGGAHQGAVPPLPPGPPPTSLPAGVSDYQATALAQQLGANAAASAAANALATRHLGVLAAAPAMPQLGAPLGGLLDCTTTLLPSASASAPAATVLLPGALLPGTTAMPTPAALPAPLTGTLPSAQLPAAMAPSMAPPLATPVALPQQPIAPPAMPPAMAPAADDPLVASAPSAEAPPVAPLNLSDELACFAMKCAVAEKELRDQTNCFHPSELWSPLRFNESTGKLVAKEARGWPESAPGALGHPENDKIDSPLEPGLSKRDVSYSTHMVRKAVSFIFNDQLDDPSSPIHERRSPHTAIAA